MIALPYADPDDESTTLGPEAGETGRTLYDNVDDFHGFSETAGNVADLAGSAYGGRYDDFSRSVTMAAGSETISGFSAAISGWNVTITVIDSRGQQWTLTRFIPEPAS